MSILKIFSRISICGLLLTSINLFSFSQNTENHEYQIKAAFLYNFTQFVEWPADAFAGSDSPLVIGILGDDPFEKYLQEIVSGENIKGHPLVIQHYKKVEDIQTCHILFITAGELSKPPNILPGLKGKSILTVSDWDGFIKEGGMIRFVKKNKVWLLETVHARRAFGWYSKWV